MGTVQIIAVWFRSMVRTRADLAAENLALRQQLAVLQQKSKRPRLRKRDRIFWAILSRIWPNWRLALFIVQPDTVVRRHRRGFKLFWRWKSRTGKVGRPKIEAESGIRREVSKLAMGHAADPIHDHYRGVYVDSFHAEHEKFDSGIDESLLAAK